MQPKTIVRISISSPYYGFLDKAIQVDDGGPLDEREYINEAIYGLLGEVNRCMETPDPRIMEAYICECLIACVRDGNDRVDLHDVRENIRAEKARDWTLRTLEELGMK